MKALNYLFLVVLFVTLTVTSKGQTSDQYFKTLCTRVQTQGEKPVQEQYNFYVDMMNKFFNNTQWKDEVLSIKQIKVKPMDDPANWYYFVMVKTKNCVKPFYLNYDSHDLNFNTSMFHLAEGYFPTEFQSYLDKLRANIPMSEMNSKELSDLAKKHWPLVLKRMQVFVSDTILVYIDKSCHSAIDTFVMKYPEADREAKKKTLWTAFTGTDKYKEKISYMKNTKYTSEIGLRTTFEDYNGGTVERAKKVHINMCQESLWTSAKYLIESCQEWLNDNADKL